MRRAGCELNPREMCALIWRVNVEFIIAANTTKQQTLLALALRTIFTVRIGVLTSKMHRAGCAFNSRGNCVFILGDNAELIIIALKLTHQNCGGG